MQRAILAAILFLTAPSAAFAQYGERWESATLTDQEPLEGAYGYNRCYYRTLGGYEFAVNTRGTCRYTVRINIETGEVRG